MEERERRIGLNEALFREANERIREVNETFATLTGELKLVCECGHGTCAEQISMKPGEYEALRAEPADFAIVPGHEIPDVEEVISRGEEYAIVRKRKASHAASPRPPTPGERRAMARQPDRFLEIYLADHLAAATAGLALVRRAARSNTGTRTGDTLRRLTAEIDEDRHTLRRLVTDLGFTGSKPKEVFAWAAEKVGRLKLNGQLRGYSRLSRVLELEALSVGIGGQAGTLADLGAGTEHGQRLRAFELHHLIERALRQREEVEQLRLEAVHQAFAGGVSGARWGATP